MPATKTASKKRMPKPDVAGYTVVSADKPLTIEITHEHVRRATCKDGGECVVAQALADHYGYGIDGFQVGSNITKLLFGKTVVRYSTPSSLANSLRMYDKTKQWHLPAGKYTLLPLAKSYRRGGRWHEKRNSGGVQSTFRGTPAAPTRHALTVCQMIMKAASN